LDVRATSHYCHTTKKKIKNILIVLLLYIHLRRQYVVTIIKK
jgi:hypothetical protein